MPTELFKRNRKLVYAIFKNDFPCFVTCCLVVTVEVRLTHNYIHLIIIMNLMSNNVKIFIHKDTKNEESTYLS